ncbi:MAG: hypothetical protein ACI9JG_000935, partial [Alphaproteobacteria bacterium]
KYPMHMLTKQLIVKVGISAKFNINNGDVNETP